MTRLALVLAYIGTVAFLGAAILNLFGLDFICYDICPPEDGLAAALAQRLTWYWDCLLPGVLALMIAWLLCLVQLGRTRRWVRFFAVLFMPLVGVALAVVAALFAADGHLLPTTWTVFSSWGARKYLVLPPLLLGPLTIILVCHALDKSRPPATMGTTISV